MMTNPNVPELSTYLPTGPRTAWTVIGSVLVAASILQPIVSSRMSGSSVAEMMAPMEGQLRAPMPDEFMWLFGGVFANIEFALAFAGVKLAAGLAILWAARSLGSPGPWPRRILITAAWIGMAAFASIGATFVASVLAFLLFGLPILPSLLALVTGLAVAYFPIRWLWGQAEELALDA